MNKEHAEHALELYAKLRGWRIVDFYERGDNPHGGCIGINYKDESGTSVYHRPKIDHPFCHEIIKGLDEPFPYFTRLAEVLNIPMRMSEFRDNGLMEIHTATVDQILEALWGLEDAVPH